MNGTSAAIAVINSLPNEQKEPSAAEGKRQTKPKFMLQPAGRTCDGAPIHVLEDLYRHSHHPYLP